MEIDPSSSPLAFFIGEVKRLRDLAGVTQEQLADVAGYAASTVAAIESSRLLPSAELAECFDRALNADGHLVRLQKLVEKTSVLPWFRDRVEVERKAHEIREYESYQVPGLLQTEDYARASISADRPMLAADVIERAVALRMTRQEILKLDQGLPPESAYGHAKHLWAIIDESALYRTVGGPQVMRAQRDHLADMAVRPHVTIQVMPFSAGVTCAYGTAFTILTSSSNSTVVYIEDAKDARYLRNRDQVGQYALLFDHLRTLALDDGRSLDLIKGDMQ
jgi:transcriptional regulator with XRE-family HTH domain